MDQDFRRQIKHLDPEDIEICKYRFMNSSMVINNLETSSHILKTIVYEMVEITGDHWSKLSLVC